MPKIAESKISGQSKVSLPKAVLMLLDAGRGDILGYYVNPDSATPQPHITIAIEKKARKK